MQSVDYLRGVGCGWAFQTGAWLADAVAADLKTGADLTAGLERYEKQCSTSSGHRLLINDLAKRSSLQ
jgi:flavin-dependent dehydrogenase